MSRSFGECYKQACVDARAQPAAGVVEGWRNCELVVDLGELGVGGVGAVGTALRRSGGAAARKVKISRSTKPKGRGKVKLMQGTDSVNTLLACMNGVFSSPVLREIHIASVPLASAMGLVKKVLTASTGVKILTLKNVKLTDAAFSEVASTIKRMSTVTQLDLSDNGLTDKSGEWLRGIVQRHQEVRDAEAFHAHLRSGGPLRLDSFRGNGLAHLDLSGNELGDGFCKAMVSVLHTDAWVTSLHLARNRVTQKGLLTLDKLIRHNTALSFIDLSHNPGLAAYTKANPLLRFTSSSPHSCIFSSDHSSTPALSRVSTIASPPQQLDDIEPPPPPPLPPQPPHPPQHDPAALRDLLLRSRNLPDDAFAAFVKDLDTHQSVQDALSVLNRIEQLPQKVSTGTSPRAVGTVVGQGHYCSSQHLCCRPQPYYHLQRAVPAVQQQGEKVKVEQERLMGKAQEAAKLVEQEQQLRSVRKEEGAWEKQQMLLAAALHEEKMVQNTILAHKMDRMYEMLLTGHRPRLPSDDRTASPPTSVAVPAPTQSASPPPVEAQPPSEAGTDCTEQTEPPDMSKVHERLFTKYDCYS